jgi:hypothetical protein
MHAGGTKMTMLLNGRSLTCAGYDRLRLLTRDATLCSLRGTSRPRTDPIYIFLKAVADTDAVIVQALIASVCGLIGSAIHAQFLPVRQVFEGGKRAPMFGNCHAEGKAGVKKQRAAETGQRRSGRQTAIVDGAAEKRFEEQASGKWQRQGDVGVCKASPVLKIDGAAKLKPGQRVGRVALHSEIQAWCQQ